MGLPWYRDLDFHGAVYFSRMRVINHNCSATKQRLHPQSVAEVSCHLVLSGDRIRQCGTRGLLTCHDIVVVVSGMKLTIA